MVGNLSDILYDVFIYIVPLRVSVCVCIVQTVDGMEWRLRDLREAECTTEKDHHLRLVRDIT